MEKLTCRCSDIWSNSEHRLMHFGLEAIPGDRAQRNETPEQRTQRIDSSYPPEHAQKLKQQYEADDKRTQAEREEHDIKSSVEFAMNGLDPAAQNFQSKLEQALRTQLMPSTQVTELGPVLRNARSVTLRRNERDGLNYTVRFLATYDGTAENVRVERAAPAPAADTEEKQEAQDGRRTFERLVGPNMKNLLRELQGKGFTITKQGEPEYDGTTYLHATAPDGTKRWFVVDVREGGELRVRKTGGKGPEGVAIIGSFKTLDAMMREIGTWQK